ncbi:MAG: NFACT RNA binding domain-containing protein, partial [Clostridia bacterium]|nr:NFACT RNA binding domain-containing protein [Clostridia bacterium]
VSVRTREGLFRMLISAATSNPRIHLTERLRENPITAPLFCMILRKHLTGGKIKNISQLGFDRIVKIDIECYTEMGDLTEKSLIIEIMGKHSNIILVQNDSKIIDSIKHVDFTTSAVRQVLPGLFYELPPAQDKISPKLCEETSLCEKIKSVSSDSLLDKLLLSEFVGMSPLMAREIVCRTTGNTKAFVCDVDPCDFAKHTTGFIKDFLSNPVGGCIVLDTDTDKPIAFSCVSLTQYTGMGKIKECDSLSQAVETFFAVRDMHDRLTQKSAGTIKLINNNIERCNKKIALHTENIRKAENREKYKIFGDLLTANLYRIKPNSESVTVENYYSENLEEVEIPLKPELSPSKNAQRYYKLYNKAKATEEHSKKQLEEAETEKEYLETVLDSVSRVSTPADITEIRDELSEQGYISAGNPKKKKAQKKSAPMEFVSSDGYTILVGRNNKQNDELTIRTAYSTDMWLHTKNIPGSHVIIRTGGTGEVPDNTLVEAATIAAYFSKAQKATGVPVDYTLVKNIRKPNGSKPGFVIYETNYTVFVTPDERLVERLKKGD